MDNEILNNFCLSYFKRYYECLRINIQVFGKQHGLDMCDHIKDVLDNTKCKDSENELNKNMNNFIDKMVEITENENK